MLVALWIFFLLLQELNIVETIERVDERADQDGCVVLRVFVAYIFTDAHRKALLASIANVQQE